MQHKNSADIHQGAYVQAVDPGAVGPNILWVDTSSGNSVLKKRNLSNNGWDQVGNPLINPMVTVGDIIRGGASGLPTRLPVGSNGQMMGVSGGIPTWVNEVTGTDFKPSGLGNATSPSRYVGATTSGPPSSGTFAVGDWIIDQTPSIWECTVAGTSGTWKQLSGGSSGGGSTGGGGSGSLVPIQVIGPLSATQSTLSFSNIPQTGFRNLVLKIYGRTTAAGVGETSVLMQLNGDSGGNYDYEIFTATATTPQAANTVNTSSMYIGNFPGATSPANTSSAHTTQINNYIGSLFKVVMSSGSHEITTGAGNQRAYLSSGVWRNTSPVNAILLSPGSGTFDIGTYACLYGEMDTPGPLLTPASNLLAETILTSSQASIFVPNIPQGYRDLRVVINGRTDAAAVSERTVLLQFNGDSGSNYDWQEISGSSATVTGTDTNATTSIKIGSMPGANSTASAASMIEFVVPSYSDATFHKNLYSRNAHVLTEASTGRRNQIYAGFWRNVAAIASLLITPQSGNFLTGTVVRVYGEPVSAGGTAYGTGTRLRISANQSIATSGVAQTVNWDTEDTDADNQHFTSAANLTGTLAKTAASQAVVGTGTLFTTELSVGQVISVPGTAAEKRVVTGITDNTHLTVNSGFANTASGQTATRLNSPIVFRQPGFYNVDLGIYWASTAIGNFTAQVKLNDTTIIAELDDPNIGAAEAQQLSFNRQFQQWDFIEAVVTQTSTTALNITADERTHFSCSSRPTVIVAIPYVNIQDQKAQNTAGGTFTSGAWQTRTLNTIISDSGSISSLSSNQITLPAGTYRVSIVSPANQCNRHQARLQNITDSTTLLLGSSEYCGTSVSSRSTISGRFTLTGSKALSVQHQCQTTENTDGFGVAANFGTEVYTVAEFWKEG